MTNYRYRLTFGKGIELRFTGHLDLHRAWERTFRRAQMPLAYSEGFNPRPKINIGAALPLGCTSGADLIDFELVQEQEVTQLKTALGQVLPPGLTISEIVVVEAESPKLQKLIDASEYVIPLSGVDKQAFQSRIQELLTLDEIPRERRGKKYNLRPLIEEMNLEDPLQLRVRLAARPDATGRPDEVLRALDLDPVPFVPHRLLLILRDLK